jgi:hypothetical protein
MKKWKFTHVRMINVVAKTHQWLVCKVVVDDTCLLL